MLFRSVQELSGEYVLYCGAVPQVTSNTTTTMLTNGNFLAFGRLTEPGTLSIVRGTENQSEVYQLRGVVLETEP